jgi:glycosyltransferase involved in cell wall biosynthesis
MRVRSGPVLFVTGHAPPDRRAAFRLLDEHEDVEFALFGGRLAHGGPPAAGAAHGGPPAADVAHGGHPDGARPEVGRELPFRHRRIAQRDLARLIVRGSYRAVICSTGGRIALPATWAGARAAGVPLILWSSLWAHPRSPAHALSFLALARLYSSADAVVTYGPHVSAYVTARGARNVQIAPQAVDNGFWAAPGTGPPTPPNWPAETATRFLFVGRPVWEKGGQVLVRAWLESGLGAPTAALVLVGVGSAPPWVPADGAAGVSVPGIVFRESVGSEELRNFYAAADVLVVPSIATRTFLEPWGLAVNEAMNQRMAIIASDKVGAAAGGLVVDGRNGLVFESGDSRSLAGALRRLAHDPDLRARLGEAGARDVRAYTPEAWARGFSAALASLGVSRGRW